MFLHELSNAFRKEHITVVLILIESIKQQANRNRPLFNDPWNTTSFPCTPYTENYLYVRKWARWSIWERKSSIHNFQWTQNNLLNNTEPFHNGLSNSFWRFWCQFPKMKLSEMFVLLCYCVILCKVQTTYMVFTAAASNLQWGSVNLSIK